MAIQYVGGFASNAVLASYTVSLTALTGGIGSAVQAGDLVIVTSGWSSAANGNPGITSPATHTEVADLYANATNDGNMAMSYFIAASTPPTSITVTGTTDNSVVSLMVFRGVDQTTPIDATTTTATGTTGFDPDPPAITPVTTGAAVVIGGLLAAGATIGTPTYTAPTGYTIGPVGVKMNSVTRSSFAMMAYKLGVTGGVAENPGILDTNFTSGSMTWCAATMALRPAAGGNIKVWNGTAWVAKPVKYWNGTAWVTKPVKRWNGSAWTVTPY